MLLRIAVALDHDLHAIDLDVDDRQHVLREFAFGALDAHQTVGHLHGDFLRNRDGQFTDS